MADTYLSRTPSSAGNQKTMTFSFLIKRSDVENEFSFLYSAGQDANNRDGIRFYNNSLDLIIQRNDYDYYRLLTTAKFRDPSAWYHIVIAIDTTDSTSSNRFKMYVNGSQITDFQTETYPPQNLDLYFNDNSVQYIGRFYSSNSSHFDGYMAETHLTDGTAYAVSTFGATNSDGVWIPAVGPSVTYGTNGFYLKFENSGAMGTDSSGNSNTFSVGGGTVRQVPDTPTNNFCTMNPLSNAIPSTLSEGNLKSVPTAYNDKYVFSTFSLTSGKWYFEVKDIDQGFRGVVLLTDSDHNSALAGSNYIGVALFTGGLFTSSGTINSNLSVFSDNDILSVAIDLDNGQMWASKNGNIDTSTTANVTGFATSGYDRDLRIAQRESGNPTTTLGFNFGNPFYSISSVNSDDNGYGNFEYAPPSGYLALCTDNLSSALTIPVNKGADNFSTVLYTGDGNSSGARNITGVGFQPDWTWIKERNNSAYHNLFDSNRGAGYVLHSNVADAEGNYTSYFTSFDSDGFTLENNAGSLNGNGDTYVGWNWKAGGTAPTNTYAVKVVSDSGNKYRFDDYGTSAITLELQEGGTFTFDQSDSSNAGHPLRFSSTADGTHGGGSEYTTGVTTTGTPGQAGAKTVITVAGSAPTLYYYCSVHSGMGGQANTGSLFGFTNVKGINQSVVSPNTTAGFSIVKYTRDGNSSTTVGHGLGKTPKVKIEKDRDTGSTNWSFITSASGSDQYGFLNLTDAFGSTTSGFTSTVFNSAMGANQGDIIAYVFAEIEGYSKFGYYTGSGNADGPFVYTGFRPAWVMIKKSNSTGRWTLQDAVREPSNVVQKFLLAESSDAEDTSAGQDLDFLSNGFKIRNSNARQNGDGDTYIYLAFAENPFVSSGGTPVTAR